MVLSATDQNTKFLILADVRVDVPTVRTSVRVGCRTPPLLQRPRLSRFTMDLWFNAERQRPNWGLSESSIICALTHLALPKKIVLKMDDLLRNRMQKNARNGERSAFCKQWFQSYMVISEIINCCHVIITFRSNDIKKTLDIMEIIIFDTRNTVDESALEKVLRYFTNFRVIERWAC